MHSLTSSVKIDTKDSFLKSRYIRQSLQWFVWEFNGLMTWEMKLLQNLVVQLFKLRYLLLAFSSVNSPYCRCVESLVMPLSDNVCNQCLWWKAEKSQEFFFVVLTSLWRHFQIVAAQLPHHRQMTDDWFSSASAESGEDGRVEVWSSHPAEEVQTLLCLRPEMRC